MFAQLLKIRYLAVVIVILAVFHAVAFLVLGARTAVMAYAHVLGAANETAHGLGVELLHSLDLLFISLVLIVLSLGIAKLFLIGDTEATTKLPSWLQIESIGELKVLLWETILTTLLIAGVSNLVAGLVTDPNWTVLVLPAAILVLALSLFLMKKG